MISNMLLSIVIPVFNQWPLTAQCLLSLRETTPGDFYQVIIVDNASTDDTATACETLGRELFNERFIYLRQEKNLNFGPACNLGSSSAKGELLFFLNNDTVPTPDWFGPLYAALIQEPELGAVGPLLLYPESERVQHLGVAFCAQKYVRHLYEFFPAKHPLALQKRHVQALTGAALLLRRQLFLGCGGFFPEYSNGFEDLELSARIIQQGLKLRCVPQSMIIHYASQTPGRYADDLHNSQLFNQRCRHLFEPDLHRLACQDGLEVLLTNWLVPYVAMPHKYHKYLLSLVAKNSPVEVYLALLETHPLWPYGYDQAARLYEDQGLWNQALEMRVHQVNLCPSRAVYQSLLRAAVKSRQPSLACEVESKLKIIDHALSDRRRLRKKALHLMRLAQDMEDACLEGIYRNAITSSF